MKKGKFVLIFVLSLISVFGCKREARPFLVPPSGSATVNAKSVSDLFPGSQTIPAAAKNPYEENAFALSEGKQLYGSFNCVGCHSHGGGGMGPPLMDDVWIYGSHPEQVFASIVEGRPNGMPSFRKKIPDYQVWRIVAYVRSMSGLVAWDAAPGRDDDLAGPKPENSRKPEKPQNSAVPN